MLHTHQVRCCHFFIVESCCLKCEFDTDVKIKNYFHYDEDQLLFCKKVHIETKSIKQNVLVIFLLLQETKNSNLFDKKSTQESVRSSRPGLFLRKGALKIYSKFTGEHPCQSVISIKLLCNFIEIALRHGCSSVNLLRIFRTAFSRNTSEWLLLERQMPYST